VSGLPSVAMMKNLKVQLARAAQMVYDSWEQDEDGNDEEYGGGGICHDIADSMVEVLNGSGIESRSVSALVGDVHVFVVAKFAEGVYSIDIPPQTYERGSAYTWIKIPGVKFRPEDIDLSLVDKNSENFEQYYESTRLEFRKWLENCGPFMVRRTWPSLIASEMEPQARRSSRGTRRRRRR
jgi:uncharacterized protein YuzB (UPF0349 family)